MKKLILALSFLLSTSAFAACFDFTENGPDHIGTNSFEGIEAQSVCFNLVSRMGGTQSMRITFKDDEGAIATIASKTEVVGRCANICRSYAPTSGSVLGHNITLEDTKIDINFESDDTDGKVTITFHGISNEYEVTAAE